jgi:hypothetical protein
LSDKVVKADGNPWVSHTIDNTSEGADGVKLGDLNGDGRPDITTSWEEGGVVKAYLNPGIAAVREPWPQVTVGTVKAVEDAIFVDLDGDGRLEVVSCSEAGLVNWHRFSGRAEQILESKAWNTTPFKATTGQQWMFAAGMDIDGQHGIDLMLGSKVHQPGPGKTGVIGWLSAPAKPGDAAAWKFHRLRDAEWIMSLIPIDMDADKDLDLVFTDRKGPKTGVFWLENPGKDAVREGAPWKEHPIGAEGRKDVMFADIGDINADGLPDVAVAVKKQSVILCLQQRDQTWRQIEIPLVARGIGTSKAVKIADINADGLMDLVCSFESANGDAEGVVWLAQQKSGAWLQRSLSGPAGVKFDLIEAIDLDDDGDLDVITTDERDNLGVVWYENPLKSLRPKAGSDARKR